ncbi:MAG: NUDIX domain-containing protein [Stomatobaculum sp.]|nr:NUDIX domain-containing protein [Stomatobaculum sp.]
MELIDLYNSNGEKTGRQILRGTPVSPDEFFLVVHLCVFDSSGRMLIQRRSPEKPRWGGIWDLSAGGFVLAGESSIEAVSREASEELGLSVCGSPRFCLRARFSQVLDDFYCLYEDIDLNSLTLQKEEVSEVRWASREEVLSLLDQEQFISYERSILETLFVPPAS